MIEPDNRETSTDNSESLPAPLHRAVDLLRADVSVRSDWRDELLREVSSSPRPAHKLPADFLPDVPGYTPLFRRAFSVQPIVAIAACAIAMLSGVGGTLAYVNRNAATSPVPSVASSESTLPLVNAARASGIHDKRQVIRFELVAPGAAQVSVVGDFNNWDAHATPLKATRDGNSWLVDLPLTAGRHVYAFVVDGDIVADPSAPRVVDHDFGVQNSVILVGSL